MQFNDRRFIIYEKLKWRYSFLFIKYSSRQNIKKRTLREKILFEAVRYLTIVLKSVIKSYKCNRYTIDITYITFSRFIQNVTDILYRIFVFFV